MDAEVFSSFSSCVSNTGPCQYFSGQTEACQERFWLRRERKNFEWNSREAKRPSSSTRGWECCRNRLQRQSEGCLLEQRGPATRRTADAAWSFSVTPNTLTGAGWYQQDIRFKDWFEGPSGIQPALLDPTVKSHRSRKFQVFLPRRQKGVWTSS